MHIFLILDRVKHSAYEEAENVGCIQTHTLSQTRSATQLYEMLDVLLV